MGFYSMYLVLAIKELAILTCVLMLLQSLSLILFFFAFQIEANSEFVNKKRASIKFLPNDLASESFLEV